MQGFIEHQQQSMQKLVEEANQKNLNEQNSNDIIDVPISEDNSTTELQNKDSEWNINFVVFMISMILMYHNIVKNITFFLNKYW